MSDKVAKRVQRHRSGLRASGLRPVQIWTTDTRRPGFAEECKRQAMLVRQSEAAAGADEAMFEASDTSGWTA
ncbi:MAG TPA: antitoxin MazE family protein [Caulobacteraceae bacterium]